MSTPASCAETGMASPFEGMKIAGDPQKPDKAPEEVCGSFSGDTQERGIPFAHNKAPRFYILVALGQELEEASRCNYGARL